MASLSNVDAKLRSLLRTPLGLALTVFGSVAFILNSVVAVPVAAMFYIAERRA